jgi:4-amino-4-deoxy-L-arabinose transferase-like glycosyltransferase
MFALNPAAKWWALGFFIALAHFLPFAFLAEQRDSGELLVTAREVLEGELPYTTAYIVKPPGVPYVLAGFMATLGGDLLTVRFLILFVSVAGALAVVGLCYALGWRGRTAFLAALLFLLAAPHYEGAQILTEPFLVLFATCGMAAWVYGLRVQSLGWAGVAGVMFAAAAWMKQVAVLGLIPVGLLLGFELLARPASRPWLLQAGFTFALGLGASLSLFILTTVQEANADAFLNCVVYGLFQRPNRMRTVANFAGSLWTRFLEFPGVWWPALALVAGEAVRWVRQGRHAYRPAILFLAVGLLAALVPVAHRFYPHYYLPALPFAAILAAVFWDDLARRLAAGFEYSVGLVGACLVGLAVINPLPRLAGAADSLRAGATVFTDLRVAGRITTITSGKPILVVPTEAHFYYLCRSRPPTPHVYFNEESIRPMAADRGAARDALLRSALRQALREERLAYVLIVGDWPVWDSLRPAERAEWSVVFTDEAWQYNTNRYDRVKIRVLARSPSLRGDN